MDESTSALEQFRQQWRREVEARSRNPKERHAIDHAGPPGPLRDSPESRQKRLSSRLPANHPAANLKDVDDEEAEGLHEEDAAGSGMIRRIEGLGVRDVEEDEFSARGSSREPTSALEHYERGVEKESQGNLGDSLSHYRKAYRLDARVEQSYKNRHFPGRSKAINPNPSGAAATVPSTAHHSSKEPQAPTTTSDLIANYAGFAIMGAPAMIEGDKPPPCPVSRLPSEVLLEVLMRTAILDPASFARLALVCKKLAYHIFTENQIWKRVALGAEFGLAGQLYDFSTDIEGRETVNRLLGDGEERLWNPKLNLGDIHAQDWREVFHSRPRIRFTGVYISTVNYARAGGASATQVTWSSPVHIVTYYRYLRFFRDGTVISLLSTNEPIDVVHHLTKENMATVRSSGKDIHPLNFTSSAPAISGPSAQNVPPTAQSLMKHALRGRWRLCHPSSSSQMSVADIATGGAGVEGDLHIETEGVGPRYMYTMHLALKSSSRSRYGVKNNKLQWKGFWSYNQLTNDWAEFQLKNDKAFFFSRVRSYGLGY